MQTGRAGDSTRTLQQINTNNGLTSIDLKFSWYFFFSDTIAFHSALTSYSTIPDESAIVFNEVVLNEGDGYVLSS